MTTISRHAARPKRIFPPETFWLCLVIFPVIFAAVICSAFTSPKSFKQATQATPITEDSLVAITISFIGDLMCHSPQYNNARQSDGTYDFYPSFEQVKPYFKTADYVIGNLETTFAGPARGYSGYPNFNTPDSYAAALKASGVDMLVTSNNHSMDMGEAGLLRTLEILDREGIAHTGTFRSKKDRDSVCVIDFNWMKVGVLNFTYGTNGAYPSASHAYMLNVTDSALVTRDIKSARAQGADIVVVFYHWGAEYKPEPVAKQDSMMKYAVAAGADLIIGAHSHVIGPVDYYKTKNARLDSGVVAWSLGNFISNQSQRYTDAGLILQIELSKNTTNNTVWISRTTYVPTWVYRGYDLSNKNYIVVPATWCGKDSLPAWISVESKTKMCGVLEDTKKIVTKYSAKPVVCE
ncbi:MAG TPA: CapA family protein [Bacteroidia bacterium]|nr:CapA family protein [Bacteroidia bacterium]